MHPAVSVIIFTVLSGAGFGAIFWIGTGIGLGDALGVWGRLLVCVAAGGFAVAGLLSSTLHLGHPERAWRAFSQWRTSWLSREGVAAVACLFIFAGHALLWSGGSALAVFTGWLAGLLALAAVFCTAMIYAQLRTVPLWNRQLTPAVYLAFALSSGFLLVAMIAGPLSFGGISTAVAALVLLVVAWIVKFAWLVQGRTASLGAGGSDRGTATGLGALGSVKLLERPHTGENYLTREMVHRIGRKHAAKLGLISVLLGLAGAGTACAVVWLLALPTGFLAAAFLLHIGGLIFERWLFFAEARHAVSLYYD